MPINDNDYNLSSNVQEFLKGTCKLEVKTDDNGIIQFDFNPGGRQDFGTVTLTPYDGVITLYYNKSVAGNGREWGDFLRKIKNWGFRNGIKETKTKNVDEFEHDMKDRKRVQSKEDSLLEGWYGNSRTSWSDSGPSSIKMIVKHSRPIGEGDQRYRHVEKIFLETERGERLLLPTKRPSVGRVYARHLAEGGEYNDDRWRHLNELSEDISKLAGFVRATRNRQFNESVTVLVSEAHHHYYSLKETIRKLQGSRGYTQYFESWKPTIMEDEGEHDYESMFRNNNLDKRIEEALPVLRKLNIRVGDIREAEEFETWANSILEDHSPIEHAKVDKFVELMKSDDLTVGPDAMNIIGQLDDLIDEGDAKDKLFQELYKKSEDPSNDAKPAIMSWLQDNKEENDFCREVYEKLEGEENESSSKEKTEPELEPEPDLVPPEQSQSSAPVSPPTELPPPGMPAAPGQTPPPLAEEEMFEKKNSKSTTPRNFVAKNAQRSGAGSHTKKGFQRHSKHKKKLGEEQLEELSTEKLAQYKKAAGKDASAADLRGGPEDIEHANKRFRGIVKATVKQFYNENPAEKETKAKQDLEESTLSRIKKLSGL